KNLSEWMKNYVWARDQHTCQYCGADPSTLGFTPHIHHIVPVARGGKNDADNLVVACDDCNFKIGTDIAEPVGFPKPAEVIQLVPKTKPLVVEPATCTCPPGQSWPLWHGFRHGQWGWWWPDQYRRPDQPWDGEGLVETEYNPFEPGRMSQ